MNNKGSKGMPVSITKNEQRILKHLSTFKYIGLFVALHGVVATLIGTYCIFFRPMTPSESVILKVLIYNSIAFVACGWYFFKMTRLLEKLNKYSDFNPELK